MVDKNDKDYANIIIGQYASLVILAAFILVIAILVHVDTGLFIITGIIFIVTLRWFYIICKMEPDVILLHNKYSDDIVLMDIIKDYCIGRRDKNELL